ncbi:hypothetical protein [Treponema ruminis]|uniref:Lipoprotein n=1 Tax=Treponema ruminis TaxID=744515 RepID=A0A7W8LKR6_9SPIR|nr:hypothetical protein [Treponema ruminis]MBB5224703.1 hypothetical protein [Treponema ruminis]
MKKFIKKILVLMTSAALAFGFASCGSGDDDNSSGGGNSNSALAIFTCNSGYDTRTLTFYNDSTFKVIVSDESGPQAAGTYKFVSGDWENGTITLNATSGYKQETFTGTKTISEKKITFSTKTYTLTGGTLKTPSDESGNSGKEPSQTEKKLLAEYIYDNLSLISFYSNNTFEFKYSDRDYSKESGTYSLVGNWNNGCVAIKNSSTSNYPKIESGVHVISDGVVKISYYKYSVKEIASGADKNVFPEMVYFPDNEEYSEKKIVNLFITNDETSESNKIYLGKIATFFFSDNTWLSTKKADSASGIQTSVLNTGTYTGVIDMNNRSYSDITLSSAGAPSASTYTLEKDNFGRVILRKSFIREYRFDADVFASKEKYINYDKINAIFDAPEEKGDNYTKEKLYVFYKYDSSSGKSLYEVLSIITAGDYTNIEVLESSTYSLSSGDWFDGSIKFSDGYFGNEIKDRVMTIENVKYTRSYPEYKDTTAANGSAAFAATILGRKYVVKFDNGTYVQYCNGQEEAKGTYTMTGDFTNGTMRLNENQEYKNGSWKTKSEIINCTITNGTLKNTYGSFTAVSSDYDVSQDSSTSTASDVYYESSFGESAVAVFRYKYEDSSGYETIYFYSDGTWKCREYTYGYRSTDYTGKWSRTSGNWTNGVISFTAETHNKRTANFGTIPLTITNGKFKMEIWDTPSIESTDSSPEYIKR